jgi:hypothetical protein
MELAVDKEKQLEEITPIDSVVPVYLLPITDEEKTERKQWAKQAAERELEEQAKAKAKESAKDKLAKLGLTEEEILALIG